MVLAVETNRLAKDILAERGAVADIHREEVRVRLEKGRDKKRLCEFELVVVGETG